MNNELDIIDQIKDTLMEKDSEIKALEEKLSNKNKEYKEKMILLEEEALENLKEQRKEMKIKKSEISKLFKIIEESILLKDSSEIKTKKVKKEVERGLLSFLDIDKEEVNLGILEEMSTREIIKYLNKNYKNKNYQNFQKTCKIIGEHLVLGNWSFSVDLILNEIIRMITVSKDHKFIDSLSYILQGIVTVDKYNMIKKTMNEQEGKVAELYDNKLLNITDFNVLFFYYMINDLLTTKKYLDRFIQKKELNINDKVNKDIILSNYLFLCYIFDLDEKIRFRDKIDNLEDQEFKVYRKLKRYDGNEIDELIQLIDQLDLLYPKIKKEVINKLKKKYESLTKENPEEITDNKVIENEMADLIYNDDCVINHEELLDADIILDLDISKTDLEVIRPKITRKVRTAKINEKVVDRDLVVYLVFYIFYNYDHESLWDMIYENLELKDLPNKGKFYKRITKCAFNTFEAYDLLKIDHGNKYYESIVANTIIPIKYLDEFLNYLYRIYCNDLKFKLDMDAFKKILEGSINNENYHFLIKPTINLIDSEYSYKFYNFAYKLIEYIDYMYYEKEYEMKNMALNKDIKNKIDDWYQIRINKLSVKSSPERNQGIRDISVVKSPKVFLKENNMYLKIYGCKFLKNEIDIEKEIKFGIGDKVFNIEYEPTDEYINIHEQVIRLEDLLLKNIRFFSGATIIKKFIDYDLIFLKNNKQIFYKKENNKIMLPYEQIDCLYSSDYEISSSSKDKLVLEEYINSKYKFMTLDIDHYMYELNKNEVNESYFIAKENDNKEPIFLINNDKVLKEFWIEDLPVYKKHLKVRFHDDIESYALFINEEKVSIKNLRKNESYLVKTENNIQKIEVKIIDMRTEYVINKLSYYYFPLVEFDFFDYSSNNYYLFNQSEYSAFFSLESSLVEKVEFNGKVNAPLGNTIDFQVDSDKEIIDFKIITDSSTLSSKVRISKLYWGITNEFFSNKFKELMYEDYERKELFIDFTSGQNLDIKLNEKKVNFDNGITLSDYSTYFNKLRSKGKKSADILVDFDLKNKRYQDILLCRLIFEYYIESINIEKKEEGQLVKIIDHGTTDQSRIVIIKSIETDEQIIKKELHNEEFYLEQEIYGNYAISVVLETKNIFGDKSEKIIYEKIDGYYDIYPDKSLVLEKVNTHNHSYEIKDYIIEDIEIVDENTKIKKCYGVLKNINNLKEYEITFKFSKKDGLISEISNYEKKIFVDSTIGVRLVSKRRKIIHFRGTKDPEEVLSIKIQLK